MSEVRRTYTHNVNVSLRRIWKAVEADVLASTSLSVYTSSVPSSSDYSVSGSRFEGMSATLSDNSN